MRKSYLYQIQVNNESEIMYFNNLSGIVEYINEVYKMPIVSFDKVENYFQSRTKKKNVILANLKLIERILQPNKPSQNKGKAKL